MFIAALASLVLAASPAAQERTENLVEKVVAVVRNPPDSAPRVITLTKLVAEARIALVGRGALLAATRTMDGPALRATLDWLIDEMLVADEAARLKVDDVTHDAIAAEVRRFAARFPSGAEYRRFLANSEVSEEELSATLARDLRVKSYLESRVGRKMRLSEAEVSDAEKERGLVSPSEKLREAFRTALVEERAKAQTDDLVAELRARADVRILEDFGKSGVGQSG